MASASFATASSGMFSAAGSFSPTNLMKSASGLSGSSSPSRSPRSYTAGHQARDGLIKRLNQKKKSQAETERIQVQQKSRHSSPSTKIHQAPIQSKRSSRSKLNSVQDSSGIASSTAPFGIFPSLHSSPRSNQHASNRTHALSNPLSVSVDNFFNISNPSQGSDSRNSKIGQRPTSSRSPANSISKTKDGVPFPFGKMHTRQTVSIIRSSIRMPSRKSGLIDTFASTNGLKEFCQIAHSRRSMRPSVNLNELILGHCGGSFARDIARPSRSRYHPKRQSIHNRHSTGSVSTDGGTGRRQSLLSNNSSFNNIPRVNSNISVTSNYGTNASSHNAEGLNNNVDRHPSPFFQRARTQPTVSIMQNTVDEQYELEQTDADRSQQNDDDIHDGRVSPNPTSGRAMSPSSLMSPPRSPLPPGSENTFASDVQPDKMSEISAGKYHIEIGDDDDFLITGDEPEISCRDSDDGKASSNSGGVSGIASKASSSVLCASSVSPSIYSTKLNVLLPTAAQSVSSMPSVTSLVSATSMTSNLHLPVTASSFGSEKPNHASSFALSASSSHRANSFRFNSNNLSVSSLPLPISTTSFGGVVSNSPSSVTSAKKLSPLASPSVSRSVSRSVSISMTRSYSPCNSAAPRSGMSPRSSGTKMENISNERSVPNSPLSPPISQGCFTDKSRETEEDVQSRGGETPPPRLSDGSFVSASAITLGFDLASLEFEIAQDNRMAVPPSLSMSMSPQAADRDDQTIDQMSTYSHKISIERIDEHAEASSNRTSSNVTNLTSNFANRVSTSFDAKQESISTISETDDVPEMLSREYDSIASIRNRNSTACQASSLFSFRALKVARDTSKQMLHTFLAPRLSITSFGQQQQRASPQRHSFLHAHILDTPHTCFKKLISKYFGSLMIYVNVM